MPSQLFTPLKVGDIEVKHRVALAPLTRFRAHENNVPSDLQVEYYTQRAQEPGTLLITEGTFISPEAGGYPNVPGIWSDAQVKGWQRVFDGIHAKGSFAFVQLWALGRQAEISVLEKQGLRLKSASNIGLKADQVSELGPTPATPEPLTKEEIDGYVQAYANAARNAIKAGADGVELHDANGYLLDQFLHEDVNNRTDEYGGSIENRTRFPLRVVDAIIEAVGASKLGIRLSPWGTFGGVSPGVSPIPQQSYFIKELESRRQKGHELAYIHMVEPRVSGTEDTDRYSGSVTELNSFVRSIWQGVLIRAGGLTEHIEEYVNADPKTLVALGRWFISNPDIVHKLRTGLPLTKYDRNTFYSQGVEGYTTYPTA